jgi:oligosaccharyltransferase complex subunit beta
VTIRPYKHDEFERFLFVAYPYYFGTFFTIVATFIFIVLYLYSGSEKAKTE